MASLLLTGILIFTSSDIFNFVLAIIILAADAKESLLIFLIVVIIIGIDIFSTNDNIIITANNSTKVIPRLFFI